MAKKESKKSDTIDETNVDDAVMDAVKTYFDKNMIVDGMFWRHCLVLLQKKYGFTLKRSTSK